MSKFNSLELHFISFATGERFPDLETFFIFGKQLRLKTTDTLYYLIYVYTQRS